MSHGDELTTSVVILSWNRLPEVVNAVDRLRGAFEGEIVVVDQGSTDGSREWLLERDDIRLVALDENVGVAEGRNIGNRLASGDIVVSLDSDAILGGGFSFTALTALFQSDPMLGVCAFRVVDPSEGYEVWPHATPEKEALHPFASTRFAGGGHAARRSAFEAVGGYDPTLFFYWEEMDLAAKLIATGYTVRYEPQFVVEHSSSSQARVMWRDGRFFYRVRNRVYLVRKYFRGWSKARELLFVGTGYMALAVREGMPRDAIRGLWAGLRMPVPLEVAQLDLDRFYSVWQQLERANRPGPWRWLRKTHTLLHREDPIDSEVG